ncbi:MAG: carboxymuconolactone decarboxylase family protein [Planctomycetes bacterium]|nr:carboxymuconolactone decarboxylase family protein [Planctomycetota bacterium]
MSSLDELSAAVGRPGGDPELRCLALLHGAAVVGRFDAVPDLLALGRARGTSRARLEECGLQVVAYGGFPRAIEFLSMLEPALDEDGDPRAVAHDARTSDERLAAGRAVFERIYARQTDDVLGTLDGLVPGFADWVLDDAYGRILSRPGLSLAEREILAVAALALAALPRPLGSHVRGALRNGSTVEVVEDILRCSMVLADPRARSVTVQALDRLSRNVYRP